MKGLLLFATCCLTLVLPAQAMTYQMPMTIGAGQSFEVTFTMPPRPNPDNNPANTIYLAMNVLSPQPATYAAATLADANTILGTNSQFADVPPYPPFYFHWKDPSSNFNGANTTVIDGSSLIDRSIQGRIVVTFDHDFNLDNFSLGAGEGFNEAIFISGTDPILTNAAVVPEPMVTTAFGLASIGIVLRRRRC